MKTKHTATLFAILAAALYAINIPLSKIMLKQVEPTMMAALLYLGAGLGLFLYGFVSGEKEKGDPLTRKELPYTIGLQHTHEHSHVHTHEHRHGDLVHTHVHGHYHTHTHIHEDEALHDHPYEENDDKAHCREHMA